MPFQIIRNDITKIKADAIVNTANPKPTYSFGTDTAIYKAAGEDDLLAERRKIGDIAPGDVAVTPAFKLKAKYILHTVGPAWIDGMSGEYDILRSCYYKSLEKAEELGCESVAFPLIATGVYGFPKDEALRIAIDEIGSFLMKSDADICVYLVVFDDSAFRLSRNLFFQVESYITDKKVIKAHLDEYGMEEAAFEYERTIERRRREEKLNYSQHGGYHSSVSKTGTTRKIFNSGTFDKERYKATGSQDTVFLDHLIDVLNEKNIDNATAYKSSNVSKNSFSKLLCGDTKVPQKRTLLGFCVGLHLTLDEAKDLLASADMAFNPHDKRDDLVRDCIINGQYNILEVNTMLYECGFDYIGNIPYDPEYDKPSEKEQKS